MAKQLESLEIRKMANGGHTVTHRFASQPNMKSGARGGMYMDVPRSEEHAFGKGELSKMVAHVTAALGARQADAKQPEENPDGE